MKAKALKINKLQEETLNTYCKNAINKGFKFKYFTVFNEKVSRWGKELKEAYIKDTYFGFTKDGNIWFWFRVNTEFCKDGLKPYVFFQHRFNSATGKYIKSINQQWNAKYILGIQDWK